jgi:hypothetical protein
MTMLAAILAGLAAVSFLLAAFHVGNDDFSLFYLGFALWAAAWAVAHAPLDRRRV